MTKGPSYWLRVDSMDNRMAHGVIHPSSLPAALSYPQVLLHANPADPCDNKFLIPPVLLREDSEALDVEDLCREVLLLRTKLADEVQHAKAMASHLQSLQDCGYEFHARGNCDLVDSLLEAEAARRKP